MTLKTLMGECLCIFILSWSFIGGGVICSLFSRLTGEGKKLFLWHEVLVLMDWRGGGLKEVMSRVRRVGCDPDCTCPDPRHVQLLERRKAAADHLLLSRVDDTLQPGLHTDNRFHAYANKAVYASMKLSQNMLHDKIQQSSEFQKWITFLIDILVLFTLWQTIYLIVIAVASLNTG